jgi:signal transduction histidine kinase
MKSQQQSIKRHQAMLTNLKTIYKSQQIVLYTIIVLFIVALTFGVLTLYSLRRNREINRVLQLQNAEILKQKDEILRQKNEILKQKEKLEELSAKAQAANEAKVNFFTNISHELRTPLTLIMGPLEELQTSNKNQPQQVHNLNLIQKNVIRLLRLINQLMDFRKIELDKMALHASENDMVSFIAEVVNSYKGMALKRNIDLRFITNEKHLNVWFDENMMDKVVFNLLSNAFKFTKDGGFVYVHLRKSEDAKEVVIKVEDNGTGMTEEEANNAFELFYQGKHDYDMGSGLGLSLSKELITLNKGSISVTSKKWVGTTFEIRLPIGSNHLNNTEIAEGNPSTSRNILPEFSIEFDPAQSPIQEQKQSATEKEYRLLLIEDDNELRTFLKTKLEHIYEIDEAAESQ